MKGRRIKSTLLNDSDYEDLDDSEEEEYYSHQLEIRQAANYRKDQI